jgi:hypothetical protein
VEAGEARYKVWVPQGKRRRTAVEQGNMVREAQAGFTFLQLQT